MNAEALQQPVIPDEVRSVAQIIDWCAAQFEAADLYFGHGTDNARDEAAWLVANRIGYPFGEARLAEIPDAQTRAGIAQLLAERVRTRKPLAYLLNEAWFAGEAYYVDERVIVPRSPIAELILEGFAPWVEPQGVEQVLDLCTGSGCIAIACAHALPRARVDAVDISAAALEVAAINVARHGVGERVRLLQGDLYAPVADRRYDIIVSNPPYVDSAEMAARAAEYRHEPELALAAGEAGLDLAIPLIEQARAHLNEQGILVLEVGASAPALEARYPRLPFIWLDFEHGGEGVALLERAALDAYFSD